MVGFGFVFITLTRYDNSTVKFFSIPNKHLTIWTFCVIISFDNAVMRSSKQIFAFQRANGWCEFAREIAEEYWHIRDGFTDGTTGTITTTRIIVSENPYISESDYHVVWQEQYFYWAMIGQNYDEKTSTPHEMKNMAEILVDRITGEITPLPDLWGK